MDQHDFAPALEGEEGIDGLIRINRRRVRLELARR